MKHVANQLGLTDQERSTTDSQIGYWALNLGKSEDMIDDAIDAIGDKISDVREYFFCGPPAPIATREATVISLASRKSTSHQPIVDWLCSPSIAANQTMQPTG